MTDVTVEKQMKGTFVSREHPLPASRTAGKDARLDRLNALWLAKIPGLNTEENGYLEPAKALFRNRFEIFIICSILLFVPSQLGTKSLCLLITCLSACSFISMMIEKYMSTTSEGLNLSSKPLP